MSATQGLPEADQAADTSLTPVRHFDVDGARKAGYSDAEIANYLAAVTGIDVDAVRRARYSDSEIIERLVAPAIEQHQPLPSPVAGGALKRLKPRVGSPSARAAAGSGREAGRGTMSRTEMLDVIYEQANEHFWLCQYAIARKDWGEAEAQRAKHQVCKESFYEIEGAPVVGQA